ncbi:immunoglobulin superfamily member 3-like [Aulostomus maculatus]
MQFSLRFLWGTSVLFVLDLLSHCAEAGVQIEVQAGPLYRVEGAPLSISCNASGFISDSAVKEFQFQYKKPGKQTNMNIISTGDQSFAYAKFLTRVRKREIVLTHVTPNSVLFEILSLQRDDEGEYTCAVVNSESVYRETYSATTTVKVIDNSLGVSSPVAPSLSYNEGDALTVTCQASSNTIQHTHLSLAWYLDKDIKTQLIMSLDRDFTLRPGPGFEGRFRAGLIRLDKTGEVTYTLTMAQLEPSDGGRLYCQAHEWIQDPDLTWYVIVQKNAGETILNVKARELRPDSASLSVRVSAQQAAVQEGRDLLLSCNIDTENLEVKFFSVAWFRSSIELARIGPTGILTVGPDYRGREKDGEFRAARIGDRDYRLILQTVRTEEQGEYTCRAWPEDRGQDGAFTQGAAQDSRPLLISITTAGSGFSVEMPNNVSVNEGDALKLTCKVHGVKGQLSITWQRKLSSAAMFTGVISLSQEGVIEDGTEFRGRKIRATRPAGDTFTLELDEVTSADTGVYQCDVSEWKINSRTNSQSQAAIVTVAPTESFVEVSLFSRNNMATMGENVELMCRIRGMRLPVTVTWSLQRDSTAIDNILTLYSDGSISWSGEQHRYQLKVAKQQGQTIHYLLINGVSHREAGSYQCRVSIFQESVHKKLQASNKLTLIVQNPASHLILTSTRALTGSINTDVELQCSVSSASSLSSRYAVTWILQQPAQNTTILTSDQFALVTFGPHLEVSHIQRISTKRTRGIHQPRFELMLRQARISDAGLYVCEVVELLQDPSGEWYQLPPVSTTTSLTLTEPANDLHLDQREQQVLASEGEEVHFNCSLMSAASSPSVFYKVTWLYTGHGSPTVRLPLVELDHTGLLTYPENQAPRGLQERLRLSRPTQSRFSLEIQTVHEGDSGSYQCQVEQYELDHEGLWQQKASVSAGPVMLSVKATESSLTIAKEDLDLNVSRSQDFSISCNIIKTSRPESGLQVTWFWQERTETKPRPVFTVYRNATLQDRLGKGGLLRFVHPSPNQFQLTFSKPVPQDSGVYFCEVEEWLPSVSRGWRRVAAETSGYLTVRVYSAGDAEAVSESGCNSGVWIGILVGIIIFSLLVICLLLLKIRQAKISHKSLGQSLWVEQHPLNTKPSAED